MQKNPRLTFVTPLRSTELALVLVLAIGAGLAVLAAIFYILSLVHLGLAVAVFGGVAVLALVAAGVWLSLTHRTGPGRTAHQDDSTGRGGSVREVVSSDGTRIHVEIDGPDVAGVTVVFCHGWIMDLTTWHKQREALQGSGVRRVFYDQRGHGLSTWEGMDRGELGVRQMAGDLAGVIDAVAPTGRLVLVGHSMGGMTLMAFAQSHLATIEERVDGVMLVATGAGPLDTQMTLGLPHFLTPAHWIVRRYAVAMIALLGLMPLGMARLLGVGPYLFSGRLLALSADAPDDAVAITTGSMWRNRLHIAAMTLRAVMTHDERDAVPALECTEVVTISPGRDRLVPTGVQLELARLIDGARTVVVPHSGHMAMLEVPERVNLELHDLVERAQQRAAAATRPAAGDLAGVVVSPAP